MHQAIEISQHFIMLFVIQLPFLILINLWRKKHALQHVRFIAITACLFVIGSLTLWPLYIGQSAKSWSAIPFNIKPFDSIAGSLRHSYYLVGLRNVLGNFVLLLPLALFMKSKGTLKNLLLGFSISLIIEVTQVILTKTGLIMTRSFDVDDLILNTAGFYFGYLLRSLLQVIWRKFTNVNPSQRVQREPNRSYRS